MEGIVFEEIAVPTLGLAAYFLVIAGVLYAVGASWLDSHLITFYPEVGMDAINEREIEQLREEAEELRKAA